MFDPETVPLAEIPDRLADLERVKARLWSRMVALYPGTVTPAEDTLLDAGQAAARLGLSEGYMYQKARSFPFTVRIGRTLKFSSRGIDEYIKRRAGRA